MEVKFCYNFPHHLIMVIYHLILSISLLSKCTINRMDQGYEDFFIPYLLSIETGSYDLSNNASQVIHREGSCTLQVANSICTTFFFPLGNLVHTLNPYREQHQISPHRITASAREVVRIKNKTTHHEFFR